MPKQSPEKLSKQKAVKKPTVAKKRKNTTTATKSKSKRAPKAASKKTVNKETQTTKKKFDSEVTVPSNMSQRAITKSLTYKAYVKRLTQNGLYAGASLCIIAGAALALYSSFNPSATLQMANVCISGNCTSTTDYSDPASIDTTTGATSPTTHSNPTATVLDSIPASLAEDLTVHIKITDGTFADVWLDAMTNQRMHLVADTALPDTYRLRIPGSTLAPDTYAIIVKLQSSDGTNHIITLKSFTVAVPVDTTSQITDTVLSSTTSSSTVSDRTVNSNQAVTTTSTPNTTNPEATVNLDSSSTTLSTGSGATTTTGTDQTEASSFSIGSIPNEISGTVIVSVRTLDTNKFVEFFLRNTQATTPLFAGLANKQFGQWRFVFDTTTYPNGEYEVFAKTHTKDGQRLFTDSVVTTIKNPVTVPVETKSDTETTVVADEVLEESGSERTDFAIREFATFEVSETKVNATADPIVSQIVATILETYNNQLQGLLERYAVAVQAGDQTLISETEVGIKTLQETIMSDVLRDQNTKQQAGSIRNELEARFSALLEKTTTFEAVRSKRSDGSSSVDTDKDGISDVDEINLYNTDPQTADTDKDGFVDGIEIIKGFDPLDSSPEATIVFESPKLTPAAVRSDVLSVDTITPLIQTNEAIGQPAIQTEITGKALPNSFVTLYIFSTPIIVTVQTDADGFYSYTLEKELVDGTHEVYAAITDNTGSIVARSTPFNFIKEANAFTPVTAQAAEVNTPAPVEVVTKHTYSTTFGLAILAFGLLLLILGLGMRNQNIIIEEQAV